MIPRAGKAALFWGGIVAAVIDVAVGGEPALRELGFVVLFGLAIGAAGLAPGEEWI